MKVLKIAVLLFITGISFSNAQEVSVKKSDAKIAAKPGPQLEKALMKKVVADQKAKKTEESKSSKNVVLAKKVDPKLNEKLKRKFAPSKEAVKAAPVEAKLREKLKAKVEQNN